MPLRTLHRQRAIGEKVPAPPIRTYVTDTGWQAERVELAASIDRVSWRDVFGNRRPVEVEIGCGHGHFLLAAARQAPDRNFFGLERSPRLATRTGAAIAAAKLVNARVLCCDARCVLSHLITPESVSAYHLYFPDPWWKRRHHKRRIHGGDFATSVARTMTPEGRLYVATDVAPVLTALSERLAAAGLERRPFPDTEITTAVARRCREANRPVHRAAFARQNR